MWTSVFKSQLQGRNYHNQWKSVLDFSVNMWCHRCELIRGGIEGMHTACEEGVICFVGVSPGLPFAIDRAKRNIWGHGERRLRSCIWSAEEIDRLKHAQNTPASQARGHTNLQIFFAQNTLEGYFIVYSTAPTRFVHPAKGWSWIGVLPIARLQHQAKNCTIQPLGE